MDAGDAGSDGCPSPRDYFADRDQDGYGDAESRVSGCEPPAGFTDREGDCDDQDPDVHDGAQETCNALDDDCSGESDDTFACSRGWSGPCVTVCGTNGNGSCADDCSVLDCAPPAEVCNYMDDDCDGLVDEALQHLIGERIQVTIDEDVRVPLVTWSGEVSFIAFDGSGGRVLSLDDTGTVVEDWTVTPFGPRWAVAATPDEIGIAVEGYSEGGDRYSLDIRTYETGLGLATDEAQGLLPGTATPMGRHDLVATATGYVAMFEVRERAGEERSRDLWVRSFDRPSGTWATSTLLEDGFGGGLGLNAATGSLCASWISDTGGTTGDAEVAILDADGDLALGPFALTSTGGTLSVARPTSVGPDWVIAIETDAGNSFIRLVLLDDQGENRIGPDEFLDVRDSGVLSGLASSGHDLLVAVHDWQARTQAFLRFAPNGELLEPEASVPYVSGDYGYASVAWVGGSYLAVWDDLPTADADDGDNQVLAQFYGCE